MTEMEAQRLARGWYWYRDFSVRRDERQGWAIFGELFRDGRWHDIYGYERTKGESLKWIDSLLDGVTAENSGQHE
jgi:hypothetical protein